MKRFFTMLAMGAVALGLSTSISAQTRGVGAGALILDDLQTPPHTIIVTAPQPGSGAAYTNWAAAHFPSLTWNIPVPPVTNAQSGFVYPGPQTPTTGPYPAANQFLYWIYPGQTSSANGTAVFGGTTGTWNYANAAELGVLTATVPLAINVIPKSDGAGGLVASGFTDNAATISTSEAFSVTGAFTASGGAANINASGAGATTIGFGGTGTVTIGNATGGTTINNPLTLSGLPSAAPTSFLALNGANQVIKSTASIVSGSGTGGNIPIWTGVGASTNLGNSSLTDNGTAVATTEGLNVGGNVNLGNGGGNTNTYGNGASDINQFGSGGSASNNFGSGATENQIGQLAVENDFGNDATTNNFGQSTGALNATNYFGTAAGTGTAANQIGVATGAGATATTTIGGGAGTNSVAITSGANWSITAGGNYHSGGSTTLGALPNGVVHATGGTGLLASSLIVNADITPGTIQNGSLQHSTIGLTSSDNSITVPTTLTLGDAADNFHLNLGNTNIWTVSQTFNGGITDLGTTNINTSGSAATNIGTGTYSGTIIIGNAGSTTDLNGTVNFTNPPSLPLPTNDIFVGIGNVATAYAPVASSVLITTAGSVPTWGTTLPGSLTIPAVTINGASSIGGSTTINTSGSITGGAGSFTTLSASSTSTLTGAVTATNAGNNIAGAFNGTVGATTPSTGAFTNLTSAGGTTNINSTAANGNTNINAAPGTAGTITIGNTGSTTDLDGTVVFANAPSIPLSTNDIFVGVGNVATAYAPVASSVLITTAGSVPTWGTTLPGSLTIPAVTINGASSIGGSTTINTSGSITGGAGSFTTLNSSSTTTLAATTATSLNSTPIGATTPSTASFTTLSTTGATNINTTTANAVNIGTGTVPNEANAIGIGNGTGNSGTYSTTTLAGLVNITGTVNFTNPPSLPLPTNDIFVGIGNVATAYAPVASSVLITTAGSVPTWGTTLPGSLTIPAVTINGASSIGGSTTINTSGSITGGAGSFTTLSASSTSTLTGAVTATNAGNNIAGAFNGTVGATTPSTGAFTNLTSAGGTTNINSTAANGNTNINAAPGTAGTITIGNTGSTTDLDGTVVFANAPSIPLSTNDIFVGVGNVATAYAPVASSVLITTAGSVPTWGTTLPGSLTIPAVTINGASSIGGSTTINTSGSITGGAGSFTTLNSSSTTTLAATTATSLNSTPIGATTPSTASFTTLSTTGATNINTTTANAVNIGTGTVPNEANAIGIGNGTGNSGTYSTTTLAGLVNITGTVNFTNPPSLPLPTNDIFVGIGNVATAYAPVASSVLITTAGSVPTWGTTLPGSLTIPAVTINGASSIGGSTTINTSGSITGGAGSFTTLSASSTSTLTGAVTATNAGNNIAGAFNGTVGATTPSTGAFTNLTSAGGTTNINSTAANGNTNINAAPGTAGTITIGNTGSTTDLDGTVVFANAPSIPLSTNDIFVGVGNVATAYAPVASSVLITTAGSVPTWGTTLPGVSGVNLTNLNGSNVASGTVALNYGGTGADYSSVAANEVFASPDGLSGAPLFRPLVANDIPTGSGNYIQNNATVTPQTGASFNIDGNGVLGGGLSVNGANGDGSSIERTDGALLIQTHSTGDNTLQMGNADGITLYGPTAIQEDASDALTFTTTGANNDITGTGGTWSVTDAGAATFASVSGDGSGLTSLTGANVTGTVANATTAVNFTGSLAGDVTGTQGATVVSNVNGSAVSGDITGNSGGFNGSLSGDVTGTQGATVVSNVNGSAVSGDITGNSGGFNGNLSGDVTGTQGATVVSNVNGSAVSSNISVDAAGFTGDLDGDVTGPQGATVFGTTAQAQSDLATTFASGATDFANSAIGLAINHITVTASSGTNGIGFTPAGATDQDLYNTTGTWSIAGAGNIVTAPAAGNTNPAITINNAGSGVDIQGSSDSWQVDHAGNAALAATTVTALTTKLVSDNSGAYGIGATENTVVETISGDVILPDPTINTGRIINIKDGSTGSIFVDPFGIETIDGVSSITLNPPNIGTTPGANPSAIIVTSDGTNWWIIGSSY